MRTTLAAAATVFAVVSCSGKTESSRLAERAAVAPAPATPRAPEPAPPVQPPPKPAAVDPTVPPPPEERVDLWLDLAPDKSLRVLTVGVLELPLVQQPTGFAREEDLTFRDCTGEGSARSCVVEHRYGRYEAEMPAGKVLEADEKRLSEIFTHHRIDARGFKSAPTTVEGGPPGPPPFAETDAGRAFEQVHRLACIRLPGEPVGVGAKWSGSCHTVFGGQVARLDVVWELSALSEDPASGKRAELTMLGKLVVPSPAGEREGVVEGKLFFFVDHHAPHILRLRARVPLKPGQAMQTTTTLNLQFGRVATDGALLRTDGAPLEAATPGWTASAVPR